MIKKINYIRKEKSIALLLFAPVLIGFVLFYFIPFIVSLYYSAVNSNYNHSIVFFDNYILLFSNKSFLLALRNTIIFVTLVVPVHMALSFILSYLADSLKGRNKSFTAVILLPVILPLNAFFYLTQYFFSQDGFINAVLNEIGALQHNWLNSSSVIWVVILIYLWKSFGFTTIIYLSGIQTLPEEYYEIADIEGITKFKCLRKITIPLLMPVHFIVVIICLTNSLGIFKEIFLINGRYPQPNIYMLQNFINNSFISLDYQKMTTSSVVVTVLVFAVLYFWILLNNRFCGDLV